MSDEILGPRLPGWKDLRGEEARVMTGTSAAVDASGKTFNVLYWTPKKGASGYNLYRSTSASLPRRARPINGKQPIRMVTSCAELKVFVPEGSREWKQLVNAFSALHSRKTRAMAADEKGRARFLDRAAGRGVRRLPGLLHEERLPWEADPCEALARGLTAEERAIFDMLANSSLAFRRARGLAYIDKDVTPDQEYYYELRAVTAEGTETVLASGVRIRAGHFKLPDPPSGLSLTAGDRRVLALWNRNPHAFSYQVRRSLHPILGYQVIHSEPVRFNIECDLQGNALAHPRPGLLDFQRWDEAGLPVDHMENGVAIHGPENGQVYYYQAAGVDILGRQGKWCPAQAAEPLCSTAPMAPDGLRVDPVPAAHGLALSWRKVTRNVDNHPILDASQSYEIYRGETQAEMEDLAGLAARLVHSLAANPGDLTTPNLNWTDSDPALAPPYGEKDYWYRVRCIDQHGAVSAPSAVISGRLPDTTPPGPTDITDAEGFADHIRVYWKPNPEPDLGGYQIYRGVCDHGQIYKPGDQEGKTSGRCDMRLVGAVSLSEAKQCLEEYGVILFDDYSVPPGSPLCYGYWVRAYDAAQNLYMGWSGCPKPGEYVCQRLYEETPPPPPVITALKARNNAVLVEWIAAPLQDLRAFHVYRAENETDPPEFVGGVLTDGTLLTDKWEGIRPSCSDIPARANPSGVRGSFLDNPPAPNTVYWYRVSALDWLGNESESADLTRIPAISTFTYSSDLPAIPVVLPPPAPGPEGCGLEVRWAPLFDATTLQGYVVFRSTAAAGDYRQVSPVVAGNTFSDESARRGVDYWYCVQAVDLQGRLSAPSAAVFHRYS